MRRADASGRERSGSGLGRPCLAGSMVLGHGWTQPPVAQGRMQAPLAPKSTVCRVLMVRSARR